MGTIALVIFFLIWIGFAVIGLAIKKWSVTISIGGGLLAGAVGVVGVMYALSALNLLPKQSSSSTPAQAKKAPSSPTPSASNSNQQAKTEYGSTPSAAQAKTPVHTASAETLGQGSTPQQPPQQARKAEEARQTEKPEILSYDQVSGDLCNKITAMTKAYAILAAQDFQTSIQSIHIISSWGATWQGKSIWKGKPVTGCCIKLDTPKGPVNCEVDTVVRYPDKTFAAHVQPYAQSVCNAALQSSMALSCP